MTSEEEKPCPNGKLDWRSAPASPAPPPPPKPPRGSGYVQILDLEPYGRVPIRDYFAGQVLSSIFAGEGATMVASQDGRYDGTNWSAVVAANAYEMADAMLAHREGSGLLPIDRIVAIRNMIALVREMRLEIGRAEWGTSDDAEEILSAFVEQFYAAMGEALQMIETGCPDAIIEPETKEVD